ncbi:hypothetical protein ACJIZ3_014193 [Penstemon smallii]|uniref:Uncharacterized protein n=1 Tax=Penstemon smallii TaxID=265156 RepID=A0ABD3RUF1_9LAMI
MLVKPMANAPPASSKLPSLPMHATETMFLSCKAIDIIQRLEGQHLVPCMYLDFTVKRIKLKRV